MSKIFITGSTDGLGFLAAQQLIKENHQVYVHARNSSRAEYVLNNLPDVANVLVADLSDLNETKQLASNLNDLGKFDTIIHNAGVLSASSKVIFTVNTLAPYVLTSLVEMPKRLIFLSSSMHKGGSPLLKLSDTNYVSYSDSKLHITTFMKTVARFFTDVYVNAIDPGWVPTKMGGASATDDLQKGYETQTWLASSQDKRALVSGCYFYHKKQKTPKQDVNNIDFQKKLLDLCETLTDVRLPTKSDI